MRNVRSGHSQISPKIHHPSITLSLGVQSHATHRAIASLEKLQLPTDKVLVAPTPLSLLWRIVVVDGDQYHEGFYAISDKKDVVFQHYPSQRNLINANAWRWPVSRLDWFTDGFIAATVKNEKLVINDLRMGIESSYVFRFDVGPLSSGDTSTVSISELLPLEFDKPRMMAVLRRAFNENQLIPAVIR